VSEADGRIPVHFFRPAEGFGQTFVIVVKHSRKRFEKSCRESCPLGFGKTERQGFDLSKGNHEAKVAAPFMTIQVRL